MNILLIGSGGREHALAWRLSQSPSCDKLFACPGNPGIGEVAELFTDPQRGERWLGWRGESDVDAICRDVWRWQSLRLPAARDSAVYAEASAAPK